MTLTLVQSISPLLAPALGGAILSIASWRTLFAIIVIMTLVTAGIVFAFLPETHPADRREGGSHSAFAVYRSLFANRRFRMMCCIAGATTAGGFGFLTAAPFVLANTYHRSEHGIGLLLTLVSLAQVAATQASPALMRRWGMDGHIIRACGVGIIIAVPFDLVAYLGELSLDLFIGFSMLMFVVYGLLLTPACVGALGAAQSHGGSAAALLAATQLSIAATASLVLSWKSYGSPGPVAADALLCIAGACFAMMVTLRPKQPISASG